MNMSNNSGATASGSVIYGLGIFGAWVYFWPQADGFWEYVLAVLEGLVWPAFLVTRRSQLSLAERPAQCYGLVARRNLSHCSFIGASTSGSERPAPSVSRPPKKLAARCSLPGPP